MKEEEQIAALERLARSQDHIPVMISLVNAFAFVAAIQLATRHPGFPSLTRGIVERMARYLQAQLSAAEPSLAELLEAGWNPAADVPAGTRRGTPPDKPA